MSVATALAADYGQKAVKWPEEVTSSLTDMWVTVFSAKIARAVAAHDGVKLRNSCRALQMKMRRAEMGPTSFPEAIKEAFTKGLKML